MVDGCKQEEIMEKLKRIVVTEISEIMTVLSDKGRIFHMENREAYGLSFCMEGQITYVHNGKKYVSDKNHAIILPQGQSYTLYGDKKGVFPVINFKCLEPLHDTFVRLEISNKDTFIANYERMRELFLFDGNNAGIMSIFYDMLYRLVENGAIYPAIIPAIKYVEENYHNPTLKTEELAEVCKISEVYLRKLFLKHLKTTPKQFLIDIRIHKAKQLLCEGRWKIHSISDMCGFSNPYHFCRLFKERTGFTPTEYVEQNRVYKI